MYPLTCPVCGKAHADCGADMIFRNPVTLQRETHMAANLWTAPERLYLDASGKAVKANDPNRVSLLVASGATLPIARARELGLVSPDAETAAPGPTPDDDAAAVERKNRNRGKAPANKAKSPPDNK